MASEVFSGSVEATQRIGSAMPELPTGYLTMPREIATEARMSLSRDEILLDNIKEALALYQRSLVWATTAALSGGLITLRLRDKDPEPIPILVGTLSAPIAWFLAQVIYVVFGALAFGALERYRRSLEELNPTREIFRAIQLFPSLATLQGRFFRLGSVLLPLGATYASWIVEMIREGPQPFNADLVFGGIFVAAILLAPYAAILSLLRTLRKWQPKEQEQAATG